MSEFGNRLSSMPFPWKIGKGGSKDIEAALQPPEEKPNSKRQRGIIRVLGGIAFLSVAIWIARVMVPKISANVSNLLNGQPPEFQIAGVASIALIVASVLGSGIYLLLRPSVRHWATESHFRNVSSMRKMVIFDAGSGALGLYRAFQQSRDTVPMNLVLFCHPPLSAVKRGSLRILGGIVARAPARDAQGSERPALAARITEGVRYKEGFKALMAALNGSETFVEWSLVRHGNGFTNLSSHVAWEEDRTTSSLGAVPARFTVYVRDETLSDIDSDDGVHNGYGKPTDVRFKGALPDMIRDLSPAVVGIGNGTVRGTGFTVDPNGIYLANAQIVNACPHVEITMQDGSTKRAETVLINNQADIAILSCPDVHDAPFLKLAGNAEAAVEMDAIALLFDAGGEGRSTLQSASGPIIEIAEDDHGKVFKIGARMPSGSIGGPLLSPSGDLIGIITNPGDDAENNHQKVATALSSSTIIDILERWSQGQDLEKAAA